MRRGTITIRALLVVFAVALAAAGCGGNGGGGGGGNAANIKIGFFSPTTGPTAADGVSAKHGAELAIEKLNSSGNRTYSLVAYDDAGDPAQAATIARKLVQQDRVAIGVSGAYSPSGAAAAPIFQSTKVPMLSAYGVSPKVTQAGDYIFRTGPAGELEGAAAAIFMQKQLKAKRLSVLAGDADPPIVTSNGVKDKAGQIGLQVVSDDKFPLSETDFRPLLGRIKAARPDAVYAAAYYDAASQLLNQAKEVGVRVPFVFGSLSDSYKVFELAKGNAEGAYLVTDFDRGERPAAKEFLQKFQAKYQVPPDVVAAASYDAVLVAGAAVEKAGSTDGTALRDGILGLTNLEQLATGPVQRVTPRRDFVRPLSVQVGKDGQWTHFATIPYDELAPQ
jgi:branched-chain amino acid transport system substrate-binding protein